MASSTGLILVNKVLRVAGENDVTTLASATANTQMIIDYINETLEEIERESNWSFLRATTTVATVASTATATITAVTNINIFRPLIRVLDTTDDFDLVELSDDKWNDVTQQSDTSTPRYYPKFGTDSSNRPTLEFYPTPSAARTYTIHYWKLLTALTADSTGDALTYPLPDSLIVNGAAWKHKDFIGDDFNTNLRKYELALRRLKDANKVSSMVVMGSRGMSRRQ